MLVHFPIALSAAALFFVVLALWRKSPALEFTAFANLALASLSTLAAGFTGLRDNFEVYGGAAPNAIWKIGLALLLLLVSASAVWARSRNPGLLQSRARLAYLAAYFVSFAISAALGFLGGVILYGF